MKKLFSDDNNNYGSVMKTAIVAFTLNPALFGSETQGLTGKSKMEDRKHSIHVQILVLR